MVLVETIVSVWLTSAIRKCGTGEDAIFVDSDDKHVIRTTGNAKMPELLAIADSLETALGKDFGSIPQVRYVLAEWVEGPLLIWIALDNPVSNVRKRVYQKELELIDAFPEVDFDFNLIPAKDRTVEDLATSARVVFSR